MRRPSTRPLRGSLTGLSLAAAPVLLLVGSVRSTAATDAWTGPASPTPGAAAWVARLDVGDTPLIQIGSTSVDVATGRVTAVPLSIDGQGPPSAHADPATPSATDSLEDWTDQTGSLTIQGGYAAATSGAQRWTARAGLGQGSGTGIAMASKLLTWDQQVQILSAVQSFNDTIIPIADEVSTGIAPLLALLGVPVPRFVPMAPSGLIDVGSGRAAGSTAEAAVAPGYASARADATAGGLRLFGGFVTVDAVSSEATVERGTADTVTARSWLTGVQIAGIPVTVDAKGIHVVRGGPFEALLTPVFDAMLRPLAVAGLTVRTIATPADGGCCSASAVGLEVSLATPSGPLVASIGGAAATSPEPLPDATGVTTSAPESALPSTAPTGVDQPLDVAAPVIEVAPAPSTTTLPTAAPRTGVLADLGPDVVRALRLTYVILLGAATAGVAHLTLTGPSRPVRPKRGPS